MELQIVDALPIAPTSLEELLSAANKEGVKSISNLIEQWESGQTRFDAIGECLFVAQSERQIIGIGGLLKCKTIPNALRVSRFYVLPQWRKRGVATLIASEVLTNVWEFTEVVTCNARASQIAPPFWESLGFSPVDVAGITHILWSRDR